MAMLSPPQLLSVECQELLKSRPSKVGFLRTPPSILRAIRSWPQSFIVLHAGCVYIYDRENSKKATKRISLYGFFQVIRAGEVTSSEQQWTFKIVNNTQENLVSYYFAAVSEEEMQGWMNAFKKESESANGASTREGRPRTPGGESYCQGTTIEAPAPLLEAFMRTLSNKPDDEVYSVIPVDPDLNQSEDHKHINPSPPSTRQKPPPLPSFSKKQAPTPPPQNVKPHWPKRSERDDSRAPRNPLPPLPETPTTPSKPPFSLPPGAFSILPMHSRPQPVSPDVSRVPSPWHPSPSNPTPLPLPARPVPQGQDDPTPKDIAKGYQNPLSWTEQRNIHMVNTRYCRKQPTPKNVLCSIRKEGVYLIRPSAQNPADQVLCVLIEGEVKQFKIIPKDNKYALSAASSARQFDSMYGMLLHYHTNSLPNYQSCLSVPYGEEKPELVGSSRNGSAS